MPSFTATSPCAASFSGESRPRGLDDLPHLAQVFQESLVRSGLVPPGQNIRIKQVPVAARAHLRANLRSRLDQPLGGQDLDRLPHHGPAYAEALAQLALLATGLLGFTFLVLEVREFASLVALGAGPSRSAPIQDSSAGRSPSPSASTEPSGRLRTHPVSPSACARWTTNQRKPTPCTRPLTVTCAR